MALNIKQIGRSKRPNRLEDKKNEQYHLDWGRYAVYVGTGNLFQRWTAQSTLNRQFWLNNQWIHTEDTEAFFKDTTLQSRNRIKVINNFIKPIVEQYRGNAAIMDISARAVPTSTKAVNRRDEQLGRALFLTDVANDNPDLRNEITQQVPIGKTKQDTDIMFENTYQDHFVEGINGLMEQVSLENDFKQMQESIALDLCLTGKAVMKYDFDSVGMKFDRIEAEYHFFDSGSEKPDLSDATFHGHYEFIGGSDVYENYDLKADDKKAIEDFLVKGDDTSSKENRVPIFHVYWKDVDSSVYGYVRDEFGYIFLTKLDNEEYEDEKEEAYSEKDLVPIADLTDRQKDVCGGSNKKRIDMDVVRFVKFIPNEYITKEYSTNKVSDIICEYGIMPYQDSTTAEFQNCNFPYKCGTWIYYDGQIDSPISALINPQRMINRYSSVMENLVNNMKGSNVFYDKDAIDPNDGGEATLLSNLSQSKPIGLRAKRTGIHNVVSEYNPKLDGVKQYIELAGLQKDSMDRIIGINESLQGQSVSANQLVGVTNSQIQRGSLIQEPFYSALTHIFLQSYQSIADVGKRFYLKHKRQLTIAIGDSLAKVLKLSEGLNMEDFRVFIKRKPNTDQEIQVGNQLLISFIAQGMIDMTGFSDMYNRSTPDQIAQKLREIAKTQAMAQKQEAENEESLMREQGMMEAQQQQQQMEVDLQGKEMDRAAETQRNEANNQAKIMSEQIKAASKNSQTSSR